MQSMEREFGINRLGKGTFSILKARIPFDKSGSADVVLLERLPQLALLGKITRGMHCVGKDDDAWWGEGGGIGGFLPSLVNYVLSRSCLLVLHPPPIHNCQAVDSAPMQPLIGNSAQICRPSTMSATMSALRSSRPTNRE